MEIIAVILIIIFVFANANDKKKKRGNTSAGQQAAKGAATPASQLSREQRQERMRQLRQQQAARRGKIASGAFGGAMERLQKTMEELDAALQPDAPVTPRKAEPVARAVAPAAVRQGEAMLADEDCHGGSMPHTHAEGHRALEDEDCYGGSMEHTHTEGVSRTAHARRMAAIDEAHDEDVLPEAIDAQALRRAVVMAEVLGKPKALRKI